MEVAPFSGEGAIMFVIPVPLKRNTPFRRSWWTHSHIRKIAFRRGDRNPYPPLLIGPPAPSNFYTREIKKMRRAGGRDADMVSHIPEISTSTATAE